MSDTDSGCLSDVDNSPPLKSLLKICLNVKPDKNVESFHQGNGLSFAKIKLNMSKALDKNKSSSSVSTRGALKKQADELMIAFGSDLAKLNKKLDVFLNVCLDCLKTVPKLRAIPLV